MIIALDTGVLGRLVHPSAEENQPVSKWVERMMEGGAQFVIPAISDYELRRSLLRMNSSRSLSTLAAYYGQYTLCGQFKYIPITREVLEDAAGLWAQARKQGRQAAPDLALDGDMILAAQSRLVKAIIATENLKHLEFVADARDWKNIEPTNFH